MGKNLAHRGGQKTRKKILKGKTKLWVSLIREGGRHFKHHRKKGDRRLLGRGLFRKYEKTG